MDSNNIKGYKLHVGLSKKISNIHKVTYRSTKPQTIHLEPLEMLPHNVL